MIATLLIAAQAAASTAPPATVQCIALKDVVAERAEGERTILFRQGTRHWRNRLPEPCPGLSGVGRRKLPAFEPFASRLCAGDRMRLLDVQFGPLQRAPVCRLGSFEPVADDRAGRVR